MMFFNRKPKEVEKVPNSELEIISVLSSSILRTYDLETLLQSAVDDVVKLYSFLGGILLLYEDEKLWAKTLTTSETSRKFLDLINVPISSLFIKVTKESDNYIVKTFNDNKIYESFDLYNFTRDVLSESVTKLSSAVTLTKSCIALPIVSGNKSIGVFFLAKSKKEDFSSELTFIKLVANQIGIAIENARLYEAINDQLKKLKKANTDLSIARQREKDIIDIMGHELRTPLSILRMDLGLVDNIVSTSSNKVLIKKLSPNLQRMKSALQREVRLLETLLTSTKVDVGKVPMNFEKVNLIDVINDSLIATQNKATEKGLKLKTSIKASSINVFADRVRLAEVIDNLVINAVKYTQEGSVTVSAEVGKKFVTVRITDTGVGISKADQKHLGEKFFRATQKIGLKHEKIVKPGGTGLGLYVSMSLVKMMGGILKFKSELGKGSEFYFTIPTFLNQKSEDGVTNQSKNVFNQLGLHK